jgi:hypothetical protein
MDAEKQQFLVTLVEYPEETVTAEYKSGLAFIPTDDFAGKLIKHVIGQANAGGGYIVLGFREDAKTKKLAPDPAMNSSVSGSYETTQLSQCVDKFLAKGQRIELLVHKIEANSVVYPVISVQGFDESPLFCGRDFKGLDGKLILKEGAIYIRDVAARTVVIAGPDQFKALLKVAVARRQSEVLNHMRSLLTEMGLSLPSGSASSLSRDAVREEQFQSWVNKQRDVALAAMLSTKKKS